MILSGSASPLSDLASRSSRDLESSRSGSLKRKHVGSTPSLSEAEPGAVAEPANGCRPTPPDEDSSSSSLSACSSDLPVCDDFPAGETTSWDSRSESFRDNFATSESPWYNRKSSFCETESSGEDYFAMSESEFNRNVLPGSGGWMMCPNVSLEAENVVRSLARESSVGSGCNVDFEDSDDPSAQSTRPCANVLVVSHGGFISQLLGHFADYFECCLPGGGKITSTITPNAALSRFFVTVSPSDAADNKNDDSECDRNFVWIRCVALHDKDHLANDVEVEPLPTSEPIWRSEHSVIEQLGIVCPIPSHPACQPTCNAAL